jgi:BMFP domain-containing protein YqiC
MQFRRAAMIAPHPSDIVRAVTCDSAAIRRYQYWRQTQPDISSDMTQTTSRFFDELAKLMTDAAGAAQGVRSEFETVMRGQAERILRDLDVVQREEFEAVKAMAQKAREENARLERRIAELEDIIVDLESLGSPPGPPRPVRRRKPKPGY